MDCEENASKYMSHRTNYGADYKGIWARLLGRPRRLLGRSAFWVGHFPFSPSVSGLFATNTSDRRTPFTPQALSQTQLVHDTPPALASATAGAQLLRDPFPLALLGVRRDCSSRRGGNESLGDACRVFFSCK
jgi:hypothetical protein